MKLLTEHTRTVLPITVAATGAVLMILELTASRTLAPAIGTSLISWTGIIGTIMAWLSVGYTLGGRLADYDTRGIKPAQNHLTELLTISGFAVLLSMLCANSIIYLTSLLPDPYVRVLFASTAMFAVPTTVMGMILPYSIKQSLRSLKDSGTVIGLMYTYSTIGSIIGTFFGGFYLLGTFGNMKVLLLLSATLLCISLVQAALPGEKNRIAVAGSVLGLLFICVLWRIPGVASLSGSVMDTDSRYNRIWIVDRIPADGSGAVRLLKTGPGAQSSMYLDGNPDLSAPYLRFFRTAYRNRPEMSRMLVIGGGAYTFPADAARRTTKTQIDVVEIDPALDAVAQKYFSFSPHPRIHIIHDDARLFIQKKIRSGTLNDYDAVFVDAFDHAYAIPSHLTTAGFIGEMKHILAPDGVVYVNIISAVTGDKGKFLRAQYWTYRQQFRDVSVFRMDPSVPPDQPQNIVLIAGQNAASEDTRIELHSLEYTGPISRDVPVFTDDFAPGEQYLAF